ncbi:hypothetical protein N7510_005488 [Penicillium lagena]|uniref:uncharacterized protein n=1 Tax=Penicillium lagena TaxID=94218 RepID=UPI00253FE2BC|nr:uncharacterized protein N7510_005488 [Penicillium lagena]KAJ5612294.1 hypothetical protein N7510_005488 [Penicillium lagena]
MHISTPFVDRDAPANTPTPFLDLSTLGPLRPPLVAIDGFRALHYRLASSRVRTKLEHEKSTRYVHPSVLPLWPRVVLGAFAAGLFMLTTPLNHTIPPPSAEHHKLPPPPPLHLQMGQSDTKLTTTNPPSFSRLESLPVEILQLIFLHSLELNLPRASPSLSRALSSNLLYTWLIRLAFSSANPGSAVGFFTPEFLPYPLDFWGLAWEQRRELQTGLLACRWCTLSFIRKCQRDYVAHVIQQKCTDLVFHPDDRALLSNLDSHFTDLTEADHATGGGRRGKGDLIIPAHLGSNENATNTTSSSRNADRKLAIWFHFGAVQIRKPHEVYYETDLFRLPCSFVIGPGRIPDKLLRAPWSEPQFEFLQLLSTDFYLDEDQVDAERSADITHWLIRKRQIEPFRRLLSMSFRSANCRVPARWPLSEELCALVKRCSTGAGDPFALAILDERWDDIPVEARHDLLRFAEVEAS